MKKSDVVYDKFKDELQSFVNDFCKKNDCDIVLMISASVSPNGTEGFLTATEVLDSREYGGKTAKEMMPLIKATLTGAEESLKAVRDLLS